MISGRISMTERKWPPCSTRCPNQNPHQTVRMTKAQMEVKTAHTVNLRAPPGEGLEVKWHLDIEDSGKQITGTHTISLYSPLGSSTHQSRRNDATTFSQPVTATRIILGVGGNRWFWAYKTSALNMLPGLRLWCCTLCTNGDTNPPQLFLPDL